MPNSKAISLMFRQRSVKKLAVKHGVSITEAEDGLGSKPHIRKVGKGKVKGENVYAAFGQTAGGRYLVVFYIRKLTSAILPISARDMDNAERKYHGKQK